MCAAIGDLAQEKGAVFVRRSANLKAAGKGYAVEVDGTPLKARTYVLAAGSWSQPMLRLLGASIEVQPVRGQILLLSLGGPPRSADNIRVATGLGACGRTRGPRIGGIAAEQALGLSPSFDSTFLGPD